MTVKDSISAKLTASASKVDEYINGLLEDRKPVVLYEASRHIFNAGGKRLRPYLVLKTCELVGGDPDQALPFAAGMEVLPTSSTKGDISSTTTGLRNSNSSMATCSSDSRGLGRAVVALSI